MSVTTSDTLGSVGGRVQVDVVMTHRLIGIAPDAQVEDALRMMAQEGVRHLPIVVKGRCSGLLTEADLLWRLWAYPGQSGLAADCAHRPAPVVDIADDLTHAAMVIDACGVDAAVVTERGRAVGILTATDIVRLVASPVDVIGLRR